MNIFKKKNISSGTNLVFLTLKLRLKCVVIYLINDIFFNYERRFRIRIFQRQLLVLKPASHNVKSEMYLCDAIIYAMFLI